MKKIMALAMSVLMAGAVLAGCGGGGADSQTSTASDDSSASTAEDGSADAASSGRRTDLRICMASTPETIDPTLNSSEDGGVYLVHLNEGLYRYNVEGNGVEPGQAESYDLSDDGLVYTFHLRDGLIWSDGQPVVAGDWVYAWQRLVDPATAAPYALDMGSFIKNGAAIVEGEMEPSELGVVAVDDKTLEVTLQNPCAFFEEIIAFPAMQPIRQDVVEAAPERWSTSPDTYVSNGAFKLTEYEIDSHLAMVPNEGYWDAETIVPTSLTFLFLADENAQLNAFRSGEADWVRNIPGEEVKSMVEQGYTTHLPLLGTYYMSMNTQRAPFDDANVRKAFSLAIDREYIANTVREGYVPAAYAYVGDGFSDAEAGSDFYEVGGPLLPTDYEESKKQAVEALAAAGYKTPDNPDGNAFPAVTYLYNEGTGHQTIAQAMQNMWKEVLGVDVTLSSQEWKVFLDTRRKGDYEMARDAWLADYNDPANLLMLNMSNGGNNNSQYRSEEFDALMDEAMAAPDVATHMEKLHEAEKLAIETDQILAPIYFYTYENTKLPELKDVGYATVGYSFFHKAYVEE